MNLRQQGANKHKEDVMFAKRIMAAAVVAAVLVGATIGCGVKNQRYGQTITEQTTTTVADLRSNPAQFAGKAVRVAGKITNECPTGGWFFLEDKTGTVYVNLHPTNVAIPQAVGRQAVAQGTVRVEGTQLEVIGTGVELP